MKLSFDEEQKKVLTSGLQELVNVWHIALKDNSSLFQPSISRLKNGKRGYTGHPNFIVSPSIVGVNVWQKIVC